jgi:hypothetical protein
MAGLDATEIVVPITGHIFVAPYEPGMALPDNVDDPLDAEFIDIGYTTNDGVTFTATPTVENIESWQKLTPTRRIVTARALTAAWSMQQWDRDTFALAFGGGDWSSAGAGSYRYDPPADSDPLPDYAVVIDAQDGDKNLRWVVSRGNVSEAVETNLTRTGASLLPVTFSALAPDDADRAWFFLTDDPAFAAAS